ncbi:hypothetical protein KY290_026163 [Solanum tuberosum]|uniref:Uncharacterized protein n=1 Tax=Solanum tuberosum TaxID=4113 RepID=A0ABQ7UWQ2_SOLTU|nr:hypothetical protein KY289_025261 [Solanum tuberosum]KAH0673920.1 hypothetical protein KY284_025007 [Solanum tuberosum]KAH0755893.1 hypothetical protein KY290_026163 [Solanum tuberosum]
MCFMSDRNESIWKGTGRNFHRNTEDLKKPFFFNGKGIYNTKIQGVYVKNRPDRPKDKRLARRFPVVSLLEFVRITIQTWIHKHNEEATKTRLELTKKYDLKLQKSVALSTSMRA